MWAGNGNLAERTCRFLFGVIVESPPPCVFVTETYTTDLKRHAWWNPILSREHEFSGRIGKACGFRLIFTT